MTRSGSASWPRTYKEVVSGTRTPGFSPVQRPTSQPSTSKPLLFSLRILSNLPPPPSLPFSSSPDLGRIMVSGKEALLGSSTTRGGVRHTIFREADAALHDARALPELALGGVQLAEGARQVLDLFVQLLLHGAQLLRAEAVEAHYGDFVILWSAVVLQTHTHTSHTTLPLAGVRRGRTADPPGSYPTPDCGPPSE